MLTDGCSSPDTVHGILLVSTFGCFSTNITWYYSFWILLNITKMHNIAQFYWYSSTWTSSIANITQCYQYYSILPIFVSFYNTVPYCVIFKHIHMIIANFGLFHVNGRVLDHQMWIPIDLRAPAWKGDPLRYSNQFHTRQIANCACWRHWNHSLSI